MGMTIWIRTLEESNYSKDSDDHSLMCRYSDELDAVTEQLNVKKLSAFFDYTDQEFNYDELEDTVDQEGAAVAMDPLTELPYGIDDMQWYDAAEGHATLTALRASVASGSVTELSAKERERLLAELDDCIARVQGPAQRGGKFHLTLVD